MVNREKRQLIIDSFKGVDFTHDDMAIDARRSPDAVNMICDQGGRPELRPGFKRIRLMDADTVMNLVNDPIVAVKMTAERLCVVTATNLYTLTPSGENWAKESAAAAGTTMTKAAIFALDDKIYVIGSGIYKCFYDGTWSDVDGYIPTTTIARTPAGGGTVYESVNKINARRKNSFLGDGESKTYWLDDAIYQPEQTEVKVWIDGVEISSDEYTKVNSLRVGMGDKYYGKIIFTEAPAKGEGVDNVVIEYRASNMLQHDIAIKNCCIVSAYGVGNDSRIFVTGNPNYPNVDWYSGLYDPTYFPDTGFTKIGDDTPIYGYLKQYGQQVIIKRATEGEAGLILRQGALEETPTVTGEGTLTTSVFALTEGASSTGLAAIGATATVNGDPMYISPEGVYGLESNSVTQQQSVQLRSYYVNSKLVKEDLKEAVCCGWGKYLVVGIKGTNRLYLADTEQTNGNRQGYPGYEWYYWELAHPIKGIFACEGRLYYISTSNWIYGIRDIKTEDVRAYADETYINGVLNEVGIKAKWTTPLLYLGDFMRYKTIAKRGTGILVKPFSRASGEILITTDKARNVSNGEWFAGSKGLDFNDVDFTRFVFEGKTEPQVKAYPKKSRKVLFMQMTITHEKAREGCGLAAIRIAYSSGSLTKKGS